MPKVLLLLTLVVFAMGVVRSFFSPERTGAMRAGRREGVGNAMAASLGIVTPFCSCSAVPLFIGFVSAGVPLGVTFSVLIAAPMVNAVAIGLLFALLGWKVAPTCLAFGLGIAIVAGWAIGKLKLESWLEPGVLKIHAGAADLPETTTTWPDRIRAGLDAVREIVGRVWYWIIAGIAAGALIHGYAPGELLAAVTAARLLRDALHLAMDGVPPEVDAEAVTAFLAARLCVARVHDLRIRAHSTALTELTAHLVMPGGHPGDAFLAEVAAELAEHFGIGRATLQIEPGDGPSCRLAS